MRNDNDDLDHIEATDAPKRERKKRSTSNSVDNSLVAIINLAREESSIESLIIKCRSKLRNICGKVIGDRSNSFYEDIFSDSLLKAHKSFGLFKPDEGKAKIYHQDEFFNWFARLTRSVTIDFYRKQAKILEQNTDQDQLISNHSDNGYSSETTLNRIIAKQVLSILKPEEREVVLKNQVEGLTIEEISKESGQTPRQVKYKLKKTMEKLINHFKLGNETSSKPGSEPPTKPGKETSILHPKGAKK